MPITMIVRSKLGCVFCCWDTGVTDLFADVLCLCCYVLQETWRLTDTPLEDSCQLLTKDTKTPIKRKTVGCTLYQTRRYC